MSGFAVRLTAVAILLGLAFWQLLVRRSRPSPTSAVGGCARSFTSGSWLERVKEMSPRRSGVYLRDMVLQARH